MTTLRSLRLAWIAVVLALIAATGFAWLRQPDDDEHASYSRHLQSAQALDTRLNEEVAKSRLGIVNHYDRLVAVWDDIAALERELGDTPSLVDATGRAEMAPRLAAYRAALRHKETLVESFKTEQAVLRSSVRAFPLAVARARDATRDDPAAAPFREALTQLEHDVMLTLVAPSRLDAERARCALVGLDSPERPMLPATLSACARGTVAGLDARRDLVAPVLVHAAVVVERQPRVERLVSSIVTQPVRARASAVLE